jgi:hypothetical protein
MGKSKAKSRPSGSSPQQLKRFGVSVACRVPFVLRCDRCGLSWFPRETEGQLERGYWKCPNGCNAPAAQGGKADGAA